MEKLNFSWLIDKEIAGHSASMSDDDLHYVRNKGIRALVRMAESHKAQVTLIQIEKAGFTDCHEPVPDFTAPKLKGCPLCLKNDEPYLTIASLRSFTSYCVRKGGHLERCRRSGCLWLSHETHSWKRAMGFECHRPTA